MNTETVASMIVCPQCKSDQITAGNKGFSTKKAIVGGILAGPIGLAGGLLGSSQTMITCLNCGYKWKPGQTKHPKKKKRRPKGWKI